MKQTKFNSSVKKQLAFIGKAAIINFILYLIMYPFNVLQLLIAFLAKIFLLFAGINASLIYLNPGILIKGTISQVGVMQTFFEILTLASITLALRKNRFFLTIIPVIIYYSFLYFLAVLLFEKNINATFLTDFIAFQAKYMLLLLVYWFMINKKFVLEMFK